MSMLEQYIFGMVIRLLGIAYLQNDKHLNKC